MVFDVFNYNFIHTLACIKITDLFLILKPKLLVNIDPTIYGFHQRKLLASFLECGEPVPQGWPKDGSF